MQCEITLIYSWYFWHLKPFCVTSLIKRRFYLIDIPLILTFSMHYSLGSNSAKAFSKGTGCGELVRSGFDKKSLISHFQNWGVFILSQNEPKSERLLKFLLFIMIVEIKENLWFSCSLPFGVPPKFPTTSVTTSYWPMREKSTMQLSKKSCQWYWLQQSTRKFQTTCISSLSQTNGTCF